MVNQERVLFLIMTESKVALNAEYCEMSF